MAHSAPSPANAVKPRPAWLRALGDDDPPASVTVADVVYDRLRIIKHDAFAATALYRQRQNPASLALGKFARRSPAFGVPLAWLGAWFHGREQRVYQRMHAAGTTQVPRLVGQPMSEGMLLPHAIVREYVAGRPLSEIRQPGDELFPALRTLVQQFHAQGIALVDLHKRENIVVGDDGRPHLFDFQISLCPTQGRLLRWLDFRSWLLGPAQRADRYHLMKHWLRLRPDQLSPAEADLNQYRPAGVRLWRRLVRPIHVARRKLLVALHVRTGRGEAETEVAPDVRS